MNTPLAPTPEKCPKCGGAMVEKKLRGRSIGLYKCADCGHSIGVAPASRGSGLASRRTLWALMLLLLCTLAAAPLQAQSSVTFQWDPVSTGTNPFTYLLRWGSATRTYTQTFNAGSATTATVTNLAIGTNYVAAFSRVNGVDSDPSNELLVVIKPPAPGNLRIPVQGASTVTGPWTNIAELTVPLSWDTNAPFFVRTAPVLELK